MSTRAQFLAERLTCLGGSDIGVIVGVNRWKTPFQLWAEKTGRRVDDADSLPMRFGTHNEVFVASEYTKATGRRVERFNAMLRHPTAPIGGHIDRLVIPEGKSRAAVRGRIVTDRGLECKTASAYALGRDSEWGPDGSDQVPESYLLQTATYQALTGCPFWDLAALIGNAELRVYELRRDLELEEGVIEIASKWWRDHVVADVPPDPVTEAEARQRWQRHEAGRLLELDADGAALVSAFAAAKAKVTAAEAEVQGIKDRLIPLLADADGVTYQGAPLATYRANKASVLVDWRGLSSRLIEDLDEETRAVWLQDFTETRPGPRVLRLARNLEA
ncbi:MAG: YqaJ viral recombinase family protein [Chromatiaceae bacterium]|nr:YqaJ viral recombinase family protein [Chromatiaceae bacterium]